MRNMDTCVYVCMLHAFSRDERRVVLAVEVTFESLLFIVGFLTNLGWEGKNEMLEFISHRAAWFSCSGI